MSLSLSRHAMQRMAQRGVSEHDLDLITLYGTEVDSGYLFTEKDYQALERELKHIIQRLRRLRGKRIVAVGDQMVTVYHATEGKTQRLLKKAYRAQ